MPLKSGMEKPNHHLLNPVNADKDSEWHNFSMTENIYDFRAVKHALFLHTQTQNSLNNVHRSLKTQKAFTPELHKCLLLCLNAQQRRYKAGTVQSQEDVCHCWTDHMLDLMGFYDTKCAKCCRRVLTAKITQCASVVYRLNSLYAPRHLHALVTTEVDLKRSLHLWGSSVQRFYFSGVWEVETDLKSASVGFICLWWP